MEVVVQQLIYINLNIFHSKSAITAASHCLHCWTCNIAITEQWIHIKLQLEAEGQRVRLAFDIWTECSHTFTGNRRPVPPVQGQLLLGEINEKDLYGRQQEILLAFLLHFHCISAHLGIQSDCCGVAARFKPKCIGNKLHFIKTFLI